MTALYIDLLIVGNDLDLDPSTSRGLSTTGPASLRTSPT